LLCPESVLIVAEAGVNHNGDLALAKQLVDVAKEAGADAVKFQSFIPEKVAAGSAERAQYQRINTGVEQQSQLEMLRDLALSEEAFIELKSYCDQQGIIFLCTPFDFESADMLDRLSVPMFKIGSGDIVNYPFLRYVANKGRPLLMSTGMATLGEVEQALAVVNAVGVPWVVLLHCTSSYPAPYHDVNLNAMVTLHKAFGVPVGYSDHTQGTQVAAAAVALGARVIEKHFTLSRSMDGPDHKASLEPHELRELVQTVRTVERCLGNGIKKPMGSEIDTMAAARRSLVSLSDIDEGEVITIEKLTFKRPGTGIPPSMLDIVIGRRARVPIPADTVITWEMV
jgi:N-acetylneuraminate synthase/N,N'-diacetyllegionaminate synthase